MNHILKTICALSLCLFSSVSFAELTGTGMNMDYLYGEDGNTSGDSHGIKLGFQGYFDNLEQWIPNLELTLESSINYLHLTENHKNDDLFIFAVSPILRYPLYQSQKFDFLIEGGVGIAGLSDRKYGDKNLGSYFTFEDRIGFAFRFGAAKRHTISTTYLHYSNGGLSNHNPGIDFFNLAYSYRF